MMDVSPMSFEMMPSGGVARHHTPEAFNGNARNYALVRQSLRLNGSRRRHTTSCIWLPPASLERVRAAHLPFSPAGSNAIWLPHESRAVRSSWRSIALGYVGSMRSSSYLAMIESLSRGDNDPPSRESGHEDTLSSPETPCEENVGLFSLRSTHQSFFSFRSDDGWVKGWRKQKRRPCDSNLGC